MDRITSGGVSLPAGAMAGPGAPPGRRATLGRDPNVQELTPAQVEEIRAAKAERDAQTAAESAPKGKRLSLRVKATPTLSEPEVRLHRFREKGGGGNEISRNERSVGRRLRMRALPRDGSDDQAQPEEAVARGLETGGSAVDSALAEKGFVLSMQFFREAPIEAIEAAYSELTRERVQIGLIVDRRMMAAAVEKCSYCGRRFGIYDPPYGRCPYEEDGIMKVILTCRNANCEKKYHDDEEELHQKHMAR